MQGQQSNDRLTMIFQNGTLNVEWLCSHRYNVCYGQTYKLYLIWYLNQMILFGLLMNEKLYNI